MFLFCSKVPYPPHSRNPVWAKAETGCGAGADLLGLGHSQKGCLPMPRALIFAALLPLAACMQEGVQDNPAPLCPAEAMQASVGQPLAVLDRGQLYQPNRIIGPNTAVTMDWRPERLNIEHDSAMIIHRIYCG